MKNLGKIKLSNIKDSQLEKEQLNQLKGGNVPATNYQCSNDCEGAGNAVYVSSQHGN